MSYQIRDCPNVSRSQLIFAETIGVNRRVHVMAWSNSTAPVFAGQPLDLTSTQRSAETSLFGVRVEIRPRFYFFPRPLSFLWLSF
jgi:hypothetical protein